MEIWKALGFGGALLFALRWLVQLAASRRAGHPVVPPSFWAISLGGSGLLLVYFSLSPHRDAVGVLANAFPATVALYNLVLFLRSDRVQKRGVGDSGDADLVSARRW